MSLERVLKDPRLVSIDHNGEKIHFWHHRQMYDIALNHGYDAEKMGEGGEITGEDILRYLWMCHLAFEPELSFEEFDMMFLPGDYKKLGAVAGQIQEKQLPKPSDDADESDAPKKTTGRSKSKKTPSSSAR